MKNETNTTTKQELLNSLRAFICQRPGFDPRNYGDVASYRADYRRALRDRDDALALLRQVELRDSVTAADIIGTGSGRLTWDGKDWQYVAGQYFPTEFRAAAGYVLADALWRATLRDYSQRKVEIDGSGMRKVMTNMLGRKLAKRFFN